MKRYGNLYPKVYDMDNIRTAHENARKGKRHYREVRQVDASPERYFKRIHYMLKNKTFRNSKYKVFKRLDGGKIREIYKLPYFPDRIIHHCIMQVVEPIWLKTLIPNTFACIKGRGIHKGVRKLKEALKDVEDTQYCLKCDVKKFYPSVDHSILKQIIRRKIKDLDLLWLLDEIIDSAPGIPIGNYLSQHFGNLYLSEIDHKMKEESKCKYYFRYCDDIVILYHEKKCLHAVKDKLILYLKELRLNLKENWQVFPVDCRSIDFLGYRFYHGYTMLRKSTVIRFKRKINKVRKYYKNIEAISIISIVMSYCGWLKHANCFNLTQKYIDYDIQNIISEICQQNKIHNPLQSAIRRYK